MVNQKKIGAGILPISKKTGRLLLGRRNFEGSHPNCWSIFGGTFEEEDGSPKITAKREFKEETRCKESYTISNEPVYVYDNNHISFYTYIGIFEDEFEPYVNGEDEHSQEHLDYGWFKIDDLKDFSDSNFIPGFLEMLKKKYETIKNIIEFHKVKK